MSELLNIAIRSLMRRKLRSWLTMLGIFIGIAAIVALISLGDGLQREVEEQFAQLGTDKIIVEPKGTFAPGDQGTTAQLTQKDLDVIDSTLGVEEAGGALFRTVKVEFDDQILYYYAWGVPNEGTELVKETFLYEVMEGRELRKVDGKKAIVGFQYATANVFDENLELRDRILLNDEKFEVVGIFDTVGNSQDDRIIAIPEDTFRDMYDSDDEWEMIIAQSNQDTAIVANRIEKNLRKSRGVKEGKEDLHNCFVSCSNSFEYSNLLSSFYDRSVHCIHNTYSSN